MTIAHDTVPLALTNVDIRNLKSWLFFSVYRKGLGYKSKGGMPFYLCVDGFHNRRVDRDGRIPLED